MPSPLERNIAYYEGNEATILDGAGTRDVVVIANCSVVGYFDSRSEALAYAAERLVPGYLVRRMSDADRPLVASNFALQP